MSSIHFSEGCSEDANTVSVIRQAAIQLQQTSDNQFLMSNSVKAPCHQTNHQPYLIAIATITPTVPVFPVKSKCILEFLFQHKTIMHLY